MRLRLNRGADPSAYILTRPSLAVLARAHEQYSLESAATDLMDVLPAIDVGFILAAGAANGRFGIEGRIDLNGTNLGPDFYPRRNRALAILGRVRHF